METFSLGKGAFTDYLPGWLDRQAATDLMGRLRTELDWSQRPIRVFGKDIMQPRLNAWAGTLPYKYSGQTLEPRQGPPFLEDLMADLSQELGTPFNHVLLNLYRDGRDNIGIHADNEPELGKDPTIASLSLGASRWFVLMPKGKRAKRFGKKFKLHHGSLLVMRGTLQHRWRHGVPKMGDVTEERINLTFRCLKGPPGWRGQD